MQKGQLSFDFILALIMITILAQVIVGFSGQFRATQDIITIRAQEKQIALGLARIIDYKKTVDPGASSQITYKIPEIYVGGTGALETIPCTISVENTEITVTVDDSDYDKLAEPVSLEIKTANTVGSHSYSCGEIITIG